MSTANPSAALDTVYEDRHYRLLHDASAKTLHFLWLPAHQDLPYEGFQEACANFVGFGFEYGVKAFLIDVRNFALELPGSFPAWQREHHYLRYRRLGVHCVAYLLPAAAMPGAKQPSQAELGFELRNFATPHEAAAWIRLQLQ